MFFYFAINFIDQNHVLSKHQYGFRKNRSTKFAVFDITDKITKATDERRFSVGTFLDLSKTFHTINHEILRKLEYYGIRGVGRNIPKII